MTPGYVGADFLALVSEAGARSVERIFGPANEPILPGNDTGDAPPGVPMDTDAATSPEPDATSGDVSTVEPAGIPAAMDALRALRRPLNAAELAPLCVTMDDFRVAMRKVQPSAKREGFATVPNVSWADVGALAPVRWRPRVVARALRAHDRARPLFPQVREELTISLLEPIARPERFKVRARRALPCRCLALSRALRL